MAIMKKNTIRKFLMSAEELSLMPPLDRNSYFIPDSYSIKDKGVFIQDPLILNHAQVNPRLSENIKTPLHQRNLVRAKASKQKIHNSFVRVGIALSQSFKTLEVNERKNDTQSKILIN